ncbi:MAG TPA: hypothetical protein VFL95_07675 [Gemmatimonadales bacterium]|nr:hypothetical protein [Gemmatimonadales bacterium]
MIARLVRGLICGLVLALGCRAPKPTDVRPTVRLTGGTPCVAGLGRLINQQAGLSDSRIVIIDPEAPAVLVIDCVAHRVDTLGRKGRGPGEYVRPVALSAKLGGGLVLLDGATARLTMWDSALRLISTVPVPAEFLEYQAAVDSRGNVYFTDPPAASPVFMGPADRAGRNPDSGLVYRALAGRFSTVDTVAEVIIRPADWIGHVAKLPRRFADGDAWGIMPDGTFWIARSRENRVDRIDPAGQLATGAALPWTPVPTTDRDVRMIPNIAGPPPDSIAWPMAKVKAPFDEAIASVDGAVWVRMSHPAASDEQDYAVFRPDGRPANALVSLPAGARVIHVGRTGVWVATQDSVGLTNVTRFSRPELH